LTRSPSARAAFVSSVIRMYTRPSPASACAYARASSSGWPGTSIVQPGSAESSATSAGAWCVRPDVDASYDAPVETRIAPTSLWPRSSLICS